MSLLALRGVRFILDDTEMVELSEEEWQVVFARTRDRLLALLSSSVPMTNQRRGSVVDPDAAVAQLRAQLQALRADAHDQAERMASTEWLWYLRRVPNSIFDRDEMVTTVTAVRRLVETISAGADFRSGAAEIGSTIAFRFSETKARNVLELCATALFINATHAHLRRAGKGNSFFVDRRLLLLDFLPDPALEAAILLYDQRGEHESALTIRAGTELLRGTSDVEQAILLVTPLRTPSVLPLPDNDGEHVVANWGASFVELARAIELTRRFPADEYAAFWASVAPLVILLRLAFHRYVHQAGSARNLLRCGYMVSPRADLPRWGELLEAAIVPDIQRLLPTVRLPKPDALVEGWRRPPDSGAFPRGAAPIVRMDDDVIYFDAAAATFALLGMMRLDASSPLIKGRSSDRSRGSRA